MPKTKSEYGHTTCRVPIDYNVWFLLEADAKRCLRTPPKQIATLLDLYYLPEEETGHLVSIEKANTKPASLTTDQMERLQEIMRLSAELRSELDPSLPPMTNWQGTDWPEFVDTDSE